MRQSWCQSCLLLLLLLLLSLMVLVVVLVGSRALVGGDGLLPCARHTENKKSLHQRSFLPPPPSPSPVTARRHAWKKSESKLHDVMHDAEIRPLITNPVPIAVW